jgi:Uma2 family endonuclease
MVQTPTRYITQEDFEQLCPEQPDRAIERTAQGELVEMSPVGGEGSSAEADLITDLNNWNRKTQLGKVFSSQCGFRLPIGSTRAPDAAWVANARWEALQLEDRIRFPQCCREKMCYPVSS